MSKTFDAVLKQIVDRHMRYDKAYLKGLIKGVRAMRESAMYELVLDEGRADERRNLIWEVGEERFVAPSAEAAATLSAVLDLDRLGRIRKRLFQANDWNDLLATP